MAALGGALVGRGRHHEALVFACVLALAAVARAFAGALALAAVAADTLHSSLARAARRILCEYGLVRNIAHTAAARTAPVNVFLSMVLLFV